MRDKKSCRATVFRDKIFVVKSERDPCLLVFEIRKRQICCVVSMRTHHCILGVGFYLAKNRVERHAFPMRAEFRPSCHAVQINRNVLGGQISKRFPIPSPQKVRTVIDRKFPLLKAECAESAQLRGSGNQSLGIALAVASHLPQFVCRKNLARWYPLELLLMRERPNWLKSPVADRKNEFPTLSKRHICIAAVSTPPATNHGDSRRSPFPDC
jgi:hypothetical protein